MSPKIQTPGSKVNLKLVGTASEADATEASRSPWALWLTYSLFAVALTAGTVVLWRADYMAWLGSLVVLHVLYLWLRYINGQPAPEPRRFTEGVVRVIEAILRAWKQK